MLAYFLTVDQQILTMFLMVAAGYLLYRFRVLTEHGLAELSQLLLKIVTPMVLLTSFQREFSKEVFFDWVVMFLVSALLYAVHILAVRIVYRDIDAPHCAESRLAVAFRITDLWQFRSCWRLPARPVFFWDRPTLFC